MIRVRSPREATPVNDPPIALKRRPVASLDNSAAPAQTPTRTEEPNPRKLGGLVLTRHLGESIMIGQDIEIEVVGLRSGTAKIKIMAPRSVAVHRREVFDDIRENPRTIARPDRPEEPATPGKPRGGLVLTRSEFQSIMIGDDIEIAVVEVRPTACKLKIAAPRSVAVHRREVFDQIHHD